MATYSNYTNGCLGMGLEKTASRRKYKILLYNLEREIKLESIFLRQILLLYCVLLILPAMMEALKKISPVMDLV